MKSYRNYENISFFYFQYYILFKILSPEKKEKLNESFFLNMAVHGLMFNYFKRLLCR